MRLPRFLRSMKPRHRTLLGGLLVGTATTLLMLLVLQGLPVFKSAELAFYDFQFNHRGSIQPSNQIVIVGVDTSAIQDLPPYINPIKRSWVGRSLDFLCGAGAKVVGIDFLYSARSTPDVYTHGSDSRALGAAVRKCGNVVLSSSIDTVSQSNLQSSQILSEPIPAIAPFTDPKDNPPHLRPPWVHVGLVNFPEDADHVIRHALNLQGFYHYNQSGTQQTATFYPSFSLVVASVALHKSVADLLRTLPTDMLVNYVGPQTVDETRATWPQVIQFSTTVPDTTFGETVPSAKPSYFRNKIVLIIPASTSFNDIKTTPFGDMYGGFVQANALNTILQHNPIIPAGDGANNLVIIIIGLLTTVVASRFGIWHSVAATLAFAIGYPIATIIAFSGYRLWLNTPTPEFTFLLTLAVIMAFRFATEERQKRHAHRKFGLYLKPEIVDIIVNSPNEDTTLEGVRRPISVLFVDIRGFTAMSEHMHPEDVVKLLDIYLEELTDSVQIHDGTLDKYVGDELMGVWNAPRVQPDHAMLAVKSALDMVGRVEKINAQLTAQHLPNIRFGIGVNTGEGIVGEMGSSFRKQYDAIGDSVNTAARLCSAAGGGEVIIGQETWEILGDRLEVEETEPLTLKGKSERLRTFQVLAIRDTPLVAADVAERTGESTATPA